MVKEFKIRKSPSEIGKQLGYGSSRISCNGRKYAFVSLRGDFAEPLRGAVNNKDVPWVTLSRLVLMGVVS